jgi:antirestriction protein ArdC
MMEKRQDHNESLSAQGGKPSVVDVHRQEFVDKILDLVQQGKMFWQKPWEVADILPVNALSGKAYRGCNIAYLLTAGMLQGYDDPRWTTYKQAQKNGWHVKRGEKGTRIEFWNTLQKDEPNAPSPSGALNSEETRQILYCKLYTVFNAAQVEGVPPLEKKGKEKKDFAFHQRSENIMANCGVLIHYGGGAAFYSPSEDKIYLPERERFCDEAHFYATALHEIAHSTGHPGRMDRKLTGSMRSPQYAREELRAEMASAFIQMDLGFSLSEEGMKEHTEQHAAYIQHWLEHLKTDYKEFYSATQDAVKISNYVLAYDKGRANIQEAEHEPPNESRAARGVLACGAIARAAVMYLMRSFNSRERSIHK